MEKIIMNIAIKAIVVSCGVLAAISAPLAAAQTNVFSGKDAFGEITGWSAEGKLYADVSFFESSTKSKSNKTESSGAYFNGYSFAGSECWYGSGSTDSIQFTAAGGPTPKQVTASGSISVTWYEYCSSFGEFTETVSFMANLTAIKDQTSHNWGTNHYEYGNVRVNSNFNYSYSPATVSASITSPAFGTVTQPWGSIGKSKGHTVDITKSLTPSP
jgi:hypothetical protein